jgi:hypothetical protein
MHVNCLIRPSPSVFLYNMLICILPASMSLYAVCPLYACIPLIHLYIYSITCMFVYSSYNNSMPHIYVPICALPILAPLFAPYLYRGVALKR